ncbi:putative asparagine synthetase [glutamine-hydrolyzing] [Zancudomyces culisetae]|uniref:asparagine synthase (glutamine-hydrolyzing) n=1 Tax=Zancudomyces culisetae TaxID=1213189 RepID=A0A1R1PFI1_ZANCU|nr:putative asparagine synthetase [glutamine-hydrolyzing] [Zancudomyces culisetae]OMH84868.1 putative asparagine synthetase [glutamine-hydrolyzing] [Zancudomyces culisetae]|eukprot:OMH79717.1 putative asparagine synthetase [glutamine-hydrolyzing] [Zancudomyces culisetae]
MCGIFCVFNYWGDTEAYRTRALELSKKLRHRGPDHNGCVIKGNNIMCHERLSIVGVTSGAQPLTNDDETLVLSINAEIYNYKLLQEQIKKPYQYKTKSDCEVIIPLYEELGVDAVKKLDGMFSFALLDVRSEKQRLIAARDPIGITTLYIGRNSEHPEAVFVASELKALESECDIIEEFPNGHYFDSETGKFVRYFNPDWWDAKRVPTTEVDYKLLRETLVKAVRKRMMSDVQFGVLLSGGLDSSLISSIAAREIKKTTGNPNSSMPLKSFSIGLPGAPDLKAAKTVADQLGTEHYGFEYTVQEGIDAVPDVIYHLETYDVTTIRASTPMYLLSRKVKALGVKMVLSGEGSDEVFGGYLYFHYAPTTDSFHTETVTRVQNLHTSDCLRANKSTMAWGLEARVPFLDVDLLQVAMNIDPKYKVCGANADGLMEKAVIRRAFDVEFPGANFTEDELKEGPYLDHDILWRQKEQFSDGVGYSWIDSLKEWAEAQVSDEKFAARATTFPHDTPNTKEAYLYRELFEKIFPNPACKNSVVRWIPRTDWGCSSDPSGRAQRIHANATV